MRMAPVIFSPCAGSQLPNKPRTYVHQSLAKKALVPLDIQSNEVQRSMYTKITYLASCKPGETDVITARQI